MLAPKPHQVFDWFCAHWRVKDLVALVTIRAGKPENSLLSNALPRAHGFRKCRQETHHKRLGGFMPSVIARAGAYAAHKVVGARNPSVSIQVCSHNANALREFFIWRQRRLLVPLELLWNGHG
jgi:hypothetical protein